MSPKPAKDPKDEKAPEKGTVAALLEAMEALPESERAALLARGFVLPHVTPGTNLNNFAFGYRCHYCNDVALEFVGDRFDDGSGAAVSIPPCNMPLDRMPWTQTRLEMNQINRARPRCQCCGQIVVLSHGFPIPKYVINIADWKSRRDRGYEQLREYRRTGVPAMKTQPDGTAVAMADSYDADDKKILRGELEQRGGIPGETPMETAAKRLLERGDTTLVAERAARFNLPDKLGMPGR